MRAAEDSSIKQKRRRQFTEHDEKFARIYENLADDSPTVRLAAAKSLLAELSPEDAPNSEIIQKVLRRLIRGLCSGRKSARYGYFIGLTELLRQKFGPQHETSTKYSTRELVSTIISLTKAEAKVGGQVRYLASEATFVLLTLSKGKARLPFWTSICLQISNTVLSHLSEQR